MPDVVRDNALTRRPYRSYEKKDRVDGVDPIPVWRQGRTGVESGFSEDVSDEGNGRPVLVLIIKLLKKGAGRRLCCRTARCLARRQDADQEKLLRDRNLHDCALAEWGVCAVYGHQDEFAVFEGQPTEAIWYFEHPMPSDRKAYSMTRPLTIDEFDLEKAWWEAREENEYAWRVPIEEIERRGYNLDIKNPHEEEVQNGDPVKLLARYEAEMDAVQTLRTALRDALAAALTQPVSADSHPRHGTAQLETADTNE